MAILGKNEVSVVPSIIDPPPNIVTRQQDTGGRSAAAPSPWQPRPPALPWQRGAAVGSDSQYARRLRPGPTLLQGLLTAQARARPLTQSLGAGGRRPRASSAPH